MREHSRDRGRLEDILKHSQNIEKIVNGISFEEFVKDIRIYYSVMKNVEVIGEAANMLTRHFRNEHTQLPWRQIIGMRHVLVHGYSNVSDEDLWLTATSEINPLRKQVEQYLSTIDWNEWQKEDDPYSETDNAAFKQAAYSARKMKEKGFDNRDIAEITGLTAEEIERL